MNLTDLIPPTQQATLITELGHLFASTQVGHQLEIPRSSNLLPVFELIVPRLLSSKWREWRSESLDGFFVATATKSANYRASLAGAAILISDQTITPFQFDIETSGSTSPQLETFRIRLGEAGRGRLGISGPPVTPEARTSMLERLIPRLHNIQWSYDEEFGRPLKKMD